MGGTPAYLELTEFAIDPTGLKVVCSEERLDDIYSHHPELVNFWADEKDMQRAISSAEKIFTSAHGEKYRVYYLRRRRKNTELKVVVLQKKDDIGELYAVQPCSKRPPGEKELWVKRATS